MTNLTRTVALTLIAIALYLVLRDGPPSPGPSKGFKAILVYETSKAMPKDQAAAFFSTRVDGYLDTHALGGRDGWRRWDRDVDVKNESKDWQEIWARVKPKMGTLGPQLVIIAGGDKFQPYPGNLDEAMKTLEKWGGK